MSARILVVDDDPVQRRLLEAMIKRFDYEPVMAESAEAALKTLDSADGAAIECIVLDLVMPDLDGMGMLGRLRERGSTLPVIVQTAQGSIDTVVSAMRAGAVDFCVKPVRAERLQVSIRNALAQATLADEVRRMQRSADGKLALKDLTTKSPRMQAALTLAEKAAASDIPVLIEGESGTGKELLARAIHAAGPRAKKPFVAVNCGAIPANLVESILFGHEKGSFTGAAERQIGKFLEADGGTLFLDEIGELPQDTQVKLLRALQEGEIDPVGARKPVKVNFRLISATNRDLMALVRQASFREDLFYRLHIYPVTLPPLRERMEDVPDLVRRFVARFAAEEGKRVRSVSAEAVRLLGEYKWPGNVRQLENTVFRSVVLAEADEIGVLEFPQIAAQVPGYEAAAFVAPAPVVASPATQPAAPLLVVEESASSAPVPGRLDVVDFHGHVRPLEQLEAEIIRYTIAHYRGRMTEVARRLGIGRSTLYRKLKELGLEADAGADHGNV
ncbi:MAG: sigma-54-dependent Fis family transcriptional regulator [Xanthobacteraceae bacterium]|nr:sigma-54-dependent Fis family transcriptional regulator [Xanthobacteraceae bacterium]QYK44605.1 MAG: sigma-54-dependent Fis family transcriptional regulator [Xanthobacteraceae bacterium]HMN50876.1 sigma-54 dependent transcriptional regulator [Xanthobacteraceae bacterium]